MKNYTALSQLLSSRGLSFEPVKKGKPVGGVCVLLKRCNIGNDIISSLVLANSTIGVTDVFHNKGTLLWGKKNV